MWWTRCKTISQKYLGWTSFQWARLPAWSANSMLQIPHVFNANGTNLFLPRFDVPFFSGFLSPLVDWNSKKNYIEWFPFQYQSKKGLKNQFLFLKLPYLWSLGNHLILLTLAFGKKPLQKLSNWLDYFLTVMTENILQFQDEHGILLPTLFWPIVRKNYSTSSDGEKLLKFEVDNQ